MASSMTMPTESVSASIVSMLSVKPMNQTRAKVAMIEVGMAMAAMTVERRLPRNSQTTKRGEDRADDQVLLDVADRRLDELRLVADDAELVARRQPGLHFGQPLLDVGGDLHGVGPRLLADLQQHRRLAVDAGLGGGLGHAVFDPGHVAQPHRVAAGLAQHHVAEAVDRRDPAAGAQGDRLRALVEAAAGDVGVLRLQGPGDVVDRQRLGAQRRRVEPDVDLALAAADHHHLADAVGALEPPAQHLVGELGDVADRLGRRSPPR